MRYSYLRRRNAAFHTLRSLLRGVVSRRPPTQAGDISAPRPFEPARLLPARPRRKDLLRTGPVMGKQ